MESRTEKRNKIQAPTLVAIVVGLHVMAVGSIVFIQGCGTTRQPHVEPPAAPVMPPQPEVREARPVTPLPPSIQPPVSVERAPATMPVADPHVYEVQRGDNLSSIASRHGVTTAEIVDLNKIKDPNAIRVGQKLLLPAHARVGTTAPRTAAPSAPATARPAAAPSAATPAVEGATYVVQAGDSLSRIASRHGVTAARLAEANNITDPNRIRVGQKLVIPGAAPAAPATAAARSAPQVAAPVASAVAPAPQPEAVRPAPAPAPADTQLDTLAEAFPFQVRTGDTIELIARDFNVLSEDIVRLNNLSPDATLRPGQMIMIPPMRD